MKRSEMLEIIKKPLYYRINGCTVCPDYLADEILSAMEEAGIYPPDTIQEGHSVTMWDKE
jgi:hypothetical protein